MQNELQHKIELFELKRQLDASHFKGLNDIQSDFVSDFSIDAIKSLAIDDYVIGKNSSSSFCYRLERQLAVIGDMRGSTSAVFVVYFGKKGKQSELRYRYTKKLGKAANEIDALEKVKAEIVDLIQAGANNDRVAIGKNRLADLFKFKILGSYYPDQYLNLYSHRHLDFFIGELGLNPEGKTILAKQDSLLTFKNNNAISKFWSNYEFNSFLYSQIGYPPSNEEDENLKDALPPIEKVEAEPVMLDISDHVDAGEKTRSGKAKIDYEKQQERNSKLGARGENIVFNWEKSFFKKRKFSLDELEHSSKSDDRLGYDIKSLDEHGDVKYIEVKATKREKGNANFIITDNERLKAVELDNYYIYVVFEAHTTSPKIWQIKEPFKGLHRKFKLSPINYRVEITVKE